jgi:hydrogenase expression/formation protein HypC
MGVPMRVVSVDREKQVAVVDNFGLELQVNISLVPDVQMGEYLMIHAGFAIGKVDLVEARESLARWEEYIRYAGTQGT